MVYWPSVNAPSKKDVSGSEYITRTRMMQGVFALWTEERMQGHIYDCLFHTIIDDIIANRHFK